MNLIVIGEVGDIAAKIVGFEAQVALERLGQARLVVVSFRRLDRQPQKLEGSIDPTVVELEIRMFSNDGV